MDQISHALLQLDVIEIPVEGTQETASLLAASFVGALATGRAAELRRASSSIRAERLLAVGAPRALSAPFGHGFRHVWKLAGPDACSQRERRGKQLPDLPPSNAWSHRLGYLRGRGGLRLGACFTARSDSFDRGLSRRSRGSRARGHLSEGGDGSCQDSHAHSSSPAPRHRRGYAQKLHHDVMEFFACGGCSETSMIPRWARSSAASSPENSVMTETLSCHERVSALHVQGALHAEILKEPGTPAPGPAPARAVNLITP